MLWMAILGTILLWLISPGAAVNHPHRGKVSSYQISPKPCWVDGQEGTCMFVYECLKSEGYHIGMCVDTFMFGSCCAHNATENTVVPNHHHHHQQHISEPSVLYTAPSQHSQITKKPIKPISHSRPSYKPKPTSQIQLSQQSTKYNSVTTTPLRPQTVETSMNNFQPPRHSIRPMSTDALAVASSINIGTYTKPGWQSTTEPGFITSLNHNSIQNEQKPNAQWQFTTEPGFVTRVKAKPTSFRPKPKPTKKPIQISTIKNTTKFNAKNTTSTKK
ncbi:unnamed protein product [Brassicogethes aeneus]|uniref:Serine proteinase stubble n=1 Tax=Brassicogethes aeneus TaxID=1431903 RepID=A0A9P0FJF7_BRAAE|nr:unnamed protein product [Brassicogethes aeneus]